MIDAKQRCVLTVNRDGPALVMSLAQHQDARGIRSRFNHKPIHALFHPQHFRGACRGALLYSLESTRLTVEENCPFGVKTLLTKTRSLFVFRWDPLDARRGNEERSGQHGFVLEDEIGRASCR